MISNATASSSFLGKDPSSEKEKKSHNKMGANQYKDRPLLDDPRVAEMLNNYHLKGITDNKVISKLLLEEHGVMLGERSVYRRKSMLGLWASKRTTQQLSDAVKRQLVAAQMAKDPTGKLGATVVKKGIFRDTGLHLTRDYIRAEMKKLDPVGHAARGPAHVKEKRRQKELEAEMAAAAASSSTTDATMETEALGSANGLSSQSRTPYSPLDENPQRTQQQQLYTISSNSFPNIHGQSSTSRSTTHLVQPPLHQLSDASLTYSQPSQYEAPSPSHRLHLQPLPLPVPLMTNNNSISTLSTSSYHQLPTSNQNDHQQDEDADYSDDYSVNGDRNPQSPPGQPNPALLQENTHGPETLTFTQQTIQTHPTPRQPPTTANQMGHLIRCLQETAPKMQDLTRCIEALNLEDEELDSQSYDIILRGMEASALLERQLSRVLSLARDRHSGKSGVAGR